MEWIKLLCSERPRKSSNPPGDYRIDFERDFDRSVFSTPIKRLQDKAQVFPLEPHDAVRTRLTHSLEVSSVARGLGIGVAKWLLDDKIIEPGMDRAIESIAATCALVHDLGNPPFGHAGEDAIRSWFSTRFTPAELLNLLDGREQLVQDFIEFEGNAQSLRIVAKLQILSDFNGLNLTFGTLSALCKYIAASHEVGKSIDHAYSKPGYFASEQRLVDKIRAKTGTGKARNPITFLVEAADDIVYSVADIEDGVKKGILSWKDLEKKISDSGPHGQAALNRMSAILKADYDKVPEGLPDDIYASAFRTAAISRLVPSVTKAFKEKYRDIMSGNYGSELVEDCEAAPLTRFLKRIGREDVYSTHPTLKLEIMGRKVICDLMDIFWEGANEMPTVGNPKPKKYSGKIGALLSENYRRAFQYSIVDRPDLPEKYHRLQLVTDYVCGMTDTFATRLHAELTNGV